MPRRRVSESKKAGATMPDIRAVCERWKIAEGLAQLNLDLPFTGLGPTITNVVCGVDLGCRIELHFIAQHARNIDYRPKRFPAAVIRIREPKATGLLFASGRVQIVGARSIDNARLATDKFARMITKLGSTPNISDFVVQNIVANADFMFPVHLEGIALRLRDYTHYEPEIFPGLVIYLAQPKITILMFAKGKIVLLGAKEVLDVERALQTVWLVALTFKKV